jgi:hypothetical protein
MGLGRHCPVALISSGNVDRKFLTRLRLLPACIEAHPVRSVVSWPQRRWGVAFDVAGSNIIKRGQFGSSPKCGRRRQCSFVSYLYAHWVARFGPPSRRRKLLRQIHTTPCLSRAAQTSPENRIRLCACRHTGRSRGRHTIEFKHFILSDAETLTSAIVRRDAICRHRSSRQRIGETAANACQL